MKRHRAWWATPGALVLIAVLPQGASDFWLFTLTLVCLYGVAAVGYNLLLGNTGQVSLAPAAFVAIGAYSVTICQDHSLSPWLGVLVGMAVAGVVSVVLGVVTLRLSGFYLALGTLSLATLVQQLAGSQKELTGGYGGTPAPTLTFFSSGYGTVVDNFYTAALVLLVVVIVARNVLRSHVGRALAVVRDAEPAAAAAGIRPRRYRLIAFVISGLLASLAGSFYGGVVGFIDPGQFGLSMTVMFVGMIIVGGIGSITGSLLGSAFFVIVPQLLNASATSQAVGFGVAIMVAMVLLPGGFVSVGERLKDALVQRRRPPAAPPATQVPEPVAIEAGSGR